MSNRAANAPVPVGDGVGDGATAALAWLPLVPLVAAGRAGVACGAGSLAVGGTIPSSAVSAANSRVR